MRVIARKKKNRAYYSLQHSYRKEGKVVTKERYLGTKIPRDIEKQKEVFLEEIKKETLYIQFGKIKKGFQEEWERYPDSIQEKVKKQLSVEFTYNTNAIEGSTITLDETRELIENRISPQKPVNDVRESELHARLFLTLLEQKETIDLKNTLHWHKELFSETKPDIAGKFRDYLVRVGKHVPPDWQDLPKLMKGLFAFYQKNKKMHPVELAARMHFKFEDIHPFGDGNGRVGRLLMNQILWLAGFPVLIIEYKKRKSYYRALRNEEKFVQYFFRRYLKAHGYYWK
jgi:Fic family protein